MNTIRKCCWLCLLLLFLQLDAQAQRSNIANTGEILVSFDMNCQPAMVMQRVRSEGFTPTKYQQISKLANIWLVQHDEKEPHTFMRWLHQQPEVRAVQLNHLVEERYDNVTTPNDPAYNQQYYLNNTGQGGGLAGSDLGANDAWDITTGGLTPLGDSIVIAVIDGGIYANHPDWGNNLWRNTHEIPNDNIDNDLNGYVDDVKGWNVFQNNDNIAGASMGHGTSVSGIIAANGNNNTGITGVNWRTKLMFVAGTNPSGSTEADVLAAYDYVYQARNRYNQTNGAKGAFVVVVNCSFGINYGMPSQFPLWCSILDSLGSVGILTVGATANSGWNVDELGDIPTTCPSEFLISTTSINNLNQKPSNRAWGPVSIDLGAYGEGAYSLGSTMSNLYATGNGTSFAAPQVSGAVGLLYSAPCANLIALAKASPSQGAKWAKTLILQSVKANNSLDSITTTGGNLHLATMLQHYQDQCQTCPSPYWLAASAIDSNQATLTWIETTEFQSIDLRWRVKGTTNWQYVPNVTSPTTLQGLTPCTEYEFIVRASCDAGMNSGWSAPIGFRTTQCCLPPETIEALPISSTEILLKWAFLPAVTGYQIEYRSSTGIWQTQVFSNNTTGYLLPDLTPCTDYQVRVKAVCASGSETEYSTLFNVETTGCGACTDLVYCSASADFATDEWIAKVKIGNSWSHTSVGNTGYQDFTSGPNAVAPIEIMANETLAVEITPGFLGFPYMETYRIFIDYNRDGDFEDEFELAFDPGFAHNGPLSGWINVPDYKGGGTTRMRVMMKFKGTQIILPTSCEEFSFGQVEDYCVSLEQTISTQEAYTKPLQLIPQPAHTYVRGFLPDLYEGPIAVRIWNHAGQIVKTMQLTALEGQFNIEPLSDLPDGNYVIQVITNESVHQEKLILIKNR